MLNDPEPTARCWKQSPLLAELKERYPYQFEQPPYDIEQNVPSGWLPLFAQLCADVDLLLEGNPRGFYWSGLKEKIGWARWSPCFNHSIDPKTKEKLHDLKYAAEEKTKYVCVACGAAISSEFQSPTSACCNEHLTEGEAFWDNVWPDTWLGKRW